MGHLQVLQQLAPISISWIPIALPPNQDKIFIVVFYEENNILVATEPLKHHD